MFVHCCVILAPDTPPVRYSMTPVYITVYDISYLACFANTLSPTYNIFQININPSRISHIYTHGRSICLLHSIISTIRCTPKGQTGFRPSVRMSGLSGLAFTLLNPIMMNTRIQQKSVPITTYIHLKGLSASLLALWSISDWFPVVYYIYI